MQPDDDRHGTIAGHAAGCKEPCCQLAKAKYDKRRKYAKHRGELRTTPALGTRRRVRALQAIGYGQPAIAEAAGISERTLHNACYRVDVVYVGTAKAVAAAYARLNMVVPKGGYAIRNRRLAERRGWPPPLAWNDIDDPHEHPRYTEMDFRDADDNIDHNVVVRILNGDRVPATNANRAERCEVVRRWPATGRPINDLARLTGWKPERYGATA